jgi:hypothetical protein
MIEIAASGNQYRTSRRHSVALFSKEEYFSSRNLLLRFLPGILSLYRKEEGRCSYSSIALADNTVSLRRANQ